MASEITAQLFQSALVETDEDNRWDIIVQLHKFGSRDVFDVAMAMVESGEPHRISLGADVIGQLGCAADDMLSPFLSEALPSLLRAADSKLPERFDDAGLAALQSVVYAVGRGDIAETEKHLLEFALHESAGIRFAATHGLLATESDDGVAALVELTRDADPDVRNWAVFGLGSVSERDSPEIRGALIERLIEVGDELADEIRGEALLGLALRKDERVVEPLIKELTSEIVGALAVEAAAEIGDSRLFDALSGLRSWWDVDTTILDEALENCRPK